MRSPLLPVFLLWLCVPGHCGDCQLDCLSCSRTLPKQLNFNTMVCLIECESNVSPAFTWDVCRKASELSAPASSYTVEGAALKRAQEEVEAMLPQEEEDTEAEQEVDRDLLNPFTLQRYSHITQPYTRTLGLDERGLGSRTSQPDSAAYKSHNNALALQEEEDEDEGGETEGDVVGAAGEQRDDQAGGLSVSKRFGGFLKGRHGYRKLVSQPGRSFQKRYGGFIGVRKSARKWNTQKRFSEFLKQYLGMSTRATQFNSMSEDLTQQNEV